MREILKKVLTLVVWTGICGLTSACYGPVELGRDIISREPTGISGGEQDDGGSDDSGTKGKSLYVTGVEYPDGYDWWKHYGPPPRGTVLFLMKDGERTVEIELDGGMSVDADMHRCLDGHLYTDSVTEAETVLEKDGEEIFRFDGREMISSMLVSGEDIYTLSVPRTGEGWFYRKNGEIVLYKGTGSPLPLGLHFDGDSVCFAYEDRIQSVPYDIIKYFYVVDGVSRAIPVPDDLVSVEDAILSGGELYYIAFRKNIQPAVLTKGMDGQTYDLSLLETMSGCRFLENKGAIFTYAKARYGESSTANFWKMTKSVASYHPSLNALAWDTDGTDVYAVCVEKGVGDASFYRNSDFQEFADGYSAVYPKIIAVCDGRYCVAVMGTKDYKPALWLDGKLLEYDFNGVFTSVSWW